MAEFFFKGNRKVTFTPYTSGEVPTVGELTGEERACDCGCMDVERDPVAADLTYYVEPQDPPPAGVTPGYIVLRRGDEMTAEVANAATLHDGTGNAAIQIDHSTWRRTKIVDDL
jgi:hypothetical protein